MPLTLRTSERPSERAVCGEKARGLGLSDGLGPGVLSLQLFRP
jgi:hypothetical protein